LLLFDWQNGSVLRQSDQQFAMETDDERAAADEEAHEDELRRQHYEDCLRSDAVPPPSSHEPVQEWVYQSPSKKASPFTTASSSMQSPAVGSNRTFARELLETPARVDKMLAAIAEREREIRQTNAKIVCSSGSSGSEEVPPLTSPLTMFFGTAHDHDAKGGVFFDGDTSLFGHLPTSTTTPMTTMDKTVAQGREEFTMESLKRNWELEDDISDVDDDDEDFLPPENRSSPLSLVPVTNTSSSSPSTGLVEISPTPATITTPATGTAPTLWTPSTSQSNTNRNNTPRDGQDLRLHGDFSVWSSGKMLNPLFLQREYVGLAGSSVSHVLSHTRMLVSLAEIAHENPDWKATYQQHLHSTTSATATTAAAAANQNQVSALEQFNDNALSRDLTSSRSTGGGSSSGGGFSDHLIHGSSGSGRLYHYMSHAVECVLRPDVELKAVMSIVVKLSKHFQAKCVLQHRNHAVVVRPRTHSSASASAFSTSSSSSTSTAGTSTAASSSSSSGIASILFPSPSSASSSTATTTPATRDDRVRATVDIESIDRSMSAPEAAKEWDQVDIQVCVSRELRQRVVFMQFMRRATGLGVLTSSLSNSSSLDFVPISKCPLTKKFVSTFKVCLFMQLPTIQSLNSI
jgi:hypothetical protein